LKEKLLKRRQEMLDLANKGVHPSVFIEQLAAEYKVSERCLWSDWERRGSWAPVLLGYEKYAGFVDMAESKLNSVQKYAWRVAVNSENPNAKVGALKIIADTVKTQSEIAAGKEILIRLERLEELAKKNAK
jgi:hypothetical protein